MLAGKVKGVNAEPGRLPVLKHDGKPSRLDLTVGRKPRQHGDAETGQGSPSKGYGVIGLEASADRRTRWAETPSFLAASVSVSHSPFLSADR